MLRPGNFMTNSLAWAPTIKSQGASYQPTGEGRWAAIDPVDIGAVAVRALTSQGHEGKGYTLTGPESLNGAGSQSGIPPAYVEALLDLFAAIKAGKADFVTDTVEKVTGRNPGTFEAWVRRNLAAFK